MWLDPGAPPQLAGLHYTTYRLPTDRPTLTVYSISTKAHTSWLRSSFSWHAFPGICACGSKTLFSIIFTTSPLAKSWIRAWMDSSRKTAGRQNTYWNNSAKRCLTAQKHQICCKLSPPMKSSMLSRQQRQEMLNILIRELIDIQRDIHITCTSDRITQHARIYFKRHVLTHRRQGPFDVSTKDAYHTTTLVVLGYHVAGRLYTQCVGCIHMYDWHRIIWCGCYNKGNKS